MSDQEIKWGGNVYVGDAEAALMGVFSGSVPDGYDGWVRDQMLVTAEDALSDVATPGPLDLNELSQAITRAAWDPLREHGIEGYAVIVRVIVPGQQPQTPDIVALHMSGSDLVRRLRQGGPAQQQPAAQANAGFRNTAVSWSGEINVVHRKTNAPMHFSAQVQWRGTVPVNNPDAWLEAMIQVSLAGYLAGVSDPTDPSKTMRGLGEALKRDLANQGANGQLSQMQLRLDDASRQRLEALVATAPSAPPPAGIPELTVEQYASLCVERAMQLHPVGQIAERYGVEEMMLIALDATWQAKLGSDLSLQQRYKQAYNQYQAWLQQQQ